MLISQPPSRAGLGGLYPLASRAIHESTIRRLPGPPLGEERAGLHLREIRAQGAGQAAGLRRPGVPEERDLARGDLDHLDLVEPLAPRQQRGPASALADVELVLAVGLHRSCTTRPSANTTAGTSSTPASAASAVARSSRSPIEPSAALLATATGCISQAAAAIRTLSGSDRSRPPANAWRKAASEKATARPICLA